MRGGKRIDLLIEAAGQLAERHGPIVVAIGGTGPAEEELRAQAARFGDKLDVRFLGKLPIGDDNRLYAAADINVFPGAVGLAIVQSMALARPTVCADEPYADSELVEHEKTGLRFARGSATVHLGGEAGIRMVVKAGDVIVIPAGVGHKNLGSSADLLVVGAYPPGRRWDLCDGSPGERPQALKNLAAVPLPSTDPVFGVNGPLIEQWIGE